MHLMVIKKDKQMAAANASRENENCQLYTPKYHLQYKTSYSKS